MYDFQKIRQLHCHGKKASEIAKELNIDPKTVRKYLHSNTPPRYTARTKPTKEDQFSAFAEVARQKREKVPGLDATELYEWLCEQGYTGSLRTVQRRLATWESEKPKERFFEQEYEPAEQSQFDFKESVELPFIEGARVVHLLFATLPYSDMCFIKSYPQKTYECFIDGMHSFFESLGGMTENVRIDNLSPCVKKILSNGERLYTEAFKRATIYYDFKVLPCSPGKGNEKGDVERDIKTWARRFKNHVKMQDLVFRDFDHLNAVWVRYMNDRRSAEVMERFQAERKKLRVLPMRDEEVLCRVEQTTAGLHGTVRINKTTYSVPDSAIGQSLRAVAGPYKVHVYRMNGTKELVAVHPKMPEGEHSILLEHVLKSLLRKPQAMVRWRHKELLFPSPVFTRFYQRLKKTEGHGAEREFLRSWNLLHYVPATEIACGMELVLESESQQLFEDLRSLLLNERRPADVVDITQKLNQSSLTPNLKQYDQLIPNQTAGGYG